MWLVAILLSAALSGHAGEPPTGCDAWAERTLKKVESKPMNRRRDVTIAAVARACGAVPASLQLAATEYGKARSDETRAEALARGAVSVLSAGCAVTAPDGFAESILATCPLPVGQATWPSAQPLGLMRASEYVFLNALVTSLLAAHAYGESAHRIVLNFVLSSANLGEARKHKIFSHGRRGKRRA